MAKNNMQISIYYIDRSLFEINDSEEIIARIIALYNSKQKHEAMVLQPNNIAGLDNLSLKLYYGSRVTQPKWVDFFKPILTDKAPMLKARNMEASYVAFFYNDKHIFALTGGQGNFAIQDYVHPYFGMEIIQRLITGDVPVIKSIQERGLTGTVLASTRHFRFDASLADEEEFGHLYQQVKAELDKKLLVEKLGFSEEDAKRNVGCIAKAAFHINKSVTISYISTIVTKLSLLLGDKPNFQINNVHFLPKKKNKKLIETLENQIYNSIYKTFNSSKLDVEFDLCHPEFEKFLGAASYTIHKTNSTKSQLGNLVEEHEHIWSEIFRCVEDENDTIETFRDYLERIRIRSYDTDGVLLTDGYLVKHINGEIRHNDKVYFVLDNHWYQLQDEFLSKLNGECKKVIDSCFNNDIANVMWNKSPDENAYNQQYFSQDNCMVVDKVLVRNIELCDILKVHEGILYLIHVKQGFGNTTRDLTSQIEIAAKQVSQIINSGNYKLIEELYESIKKKQKNNAYFKKVAHQTDEITKEEFIQIFKNKIVLCFAFYDTGITQRDIRDINKFRSNIAKYSVVQMYRRLRSIEIPLIICQIKD
ncbi:DUF6119 family protein [Anaerospora sp.]|uniref:DUF6119 family protein n=1 Tax=Anaerospora sp. TaxID=1960278 RepID=UPI0028A01D5C|nr:DUF6119 family protein [Anaerospora sp.]